MDAAPGSGGLEGDDGQNDQLNQNALQQQLVQQLSQQLSQQIGNKFPQGNLGLVAALANVQSQIQKFDAEAHQHPPPRQQQQQSTPADLLALARSGNLHGMAGFFSGKQNTFATDPSGQISTHQHHHQQHEHRQQKPRPTEENTASISNQTRGQKSCSNDARRRLLQQLSKTAPVPAACNEDKTTTSLPSLCHVGEIRAGFQGKLSLTTSSNLTSDAVKDERRKAPGSVIVPCRARGMPMDHNFKTAYFVIPESVRHGEELICSYFACRNAGVKFRYCSHCKVPVAKRNFRKRHKHGDYVGKDREDDEQSGTEEDGCSDEGESTAIPPRQDAVPSQVTTAHSSGIIHLKAVPSSVATNEERGSKGSGVEDWSEKACHIPSQVLTDRSSKHDMSYPHKLGDHDRKVGGDDVSSVCMRSGDDRAKVIESRQQRWAYLLERRPQTKDGEAMSSWLMQVLAVSDLWKPLDETQKIEPASIDLIRECAKVTIGKKRERSGSLEPKSNDSGSSDSRDTIIFSEHAGGNPGEITSNSSDNQENEMGCILSGDEARVSQKKKRRVLKKRPVVAVHTGKEGKNVPPSLE